MSLYILDYKDIKIEMGQPNWVLTTNFNKILMLMRPLVENKKLKKRNILKITISLCL